MFVGAILKSLSLKSGTVLIAALAASALDALPAVAGPQRLVYVPVSDVTRPPVGWLEFCARQPGECAGARTPPRRPALSPEAWKDLVRGIFWKQGVRAAHTSADKYEPYHVHPQHGAGPISLGGNNSSGFKGSRTLLEHLISVID